MNTDAIRKRLHEYIDSASDKKVEAFFTIIEGELDDRYDSPLDDPAFVAEMDRRYNELISGEVEGIPWEEVKKRIESRKPLMNVL